VSFWLRLYPEEESVAVEIVEEPEARPSFSKGLIFMPTSGVDDVIEIDGAEDTNPRPVTASDARGSQKTEPTEKDRMKAKSKTAQGGR
jgi:hypothetical protein